MFSMINKRKHISSSKGSQYTLQQAKRRPSQELGSSHVARDDSEIMKSIMNCCSCKPQCIQLLFQNEKGLVDFNAAISYVRRCQSNSHGLDEDDRDHFIINKFKESIVNLDE